MLSTFGQSLSLIHIFSQQCRQTLGAEVHLDEPAVFERGRLQDGGQVWLEPTCFTAVAQVATPGAGLDLDRCRDVRVQRGEVPDLSLIHI